MNASLLVVVTDVLEQLPTRMEAVFIFGHFQLGLDCSKARFRKRVVVAVFRPAHALSHAGPPQDAAKLTTRVLAAAVAVVDQSRPQHSPDR